MVMNNIENQGDEVTYSGDFQMSLKINKHQNHLGNIKNISIFIFHHLNFITGCWEYAKISVTSVSEQLQILVLKNYSCDIYNMETKYK